jgi:hypothetical protein
MLTERVGEAVAGAKRPASPSNLFSGVQAQNFVTDLLCVVLERGSFRGMEGVIAEIRSV